MFKTHRTYTLTTGIKGSTIAVINDGEFVTVVYHKTRVVEKRAKSIIIKDGGWDTVSTRMVINRALEQMCASRAFLYRKKGRTWLHHNGLDTEWQGIASLKTFYKVCA